jgi:hypothetical protein
MFYNGAFSIAAKNDLDDQNLLLATVYIELRNYTVWKSLDKYNLKRLYFFLRTVLKFVRNIV